jgi:hypothetical protein
MGDLVRRRGGWVHRKLIAGRMRDKCELTCWEIYSGYRPHRWQMESSFRSISATNKLERRRDLALGVWCCGVWCAMCGV